MQGARQVGFISSIKNIYFKYFGGRLDNPLSRDDPKYKDDEDAYEDDLEEMQMKTDALKPKDFPYTFYLMDEAQEKAFDDPIFATYRSWMVNGFRKFIIILICI